MIIMFVLMVIITIIGIIDYEANEVKYYDKRREYYNNFYRKEESK